MSICTSMYHTSVSVLMQLCYFVQINLAAYDVSLEVAVRSECECWRPHVEEKLQSLIDCTNDLRGKHRGQKLRGKSLWQQFGFLKKMEKTCGIPLQMLQCKLIDGIPKKNASRII